MDVVFSSVDESSVNRVSPAATSDFEEGDEVLNAPVASSHSFSFIWDGEWPGAKALNRIGSIYMDRVSGEVEESQTNQTHLETANIPQKAVQ